MDRSISRRHSLHPLKITKESFCKILTRHGVKASFLDLVFGFRATDELSEKGFSLGSARMNEPGQYGMDSAANGRFIDSLLSLEICYQLRYVERNDHKQGRKWSERQIGVYHKFSEARQEPGIMILLHAMQNSRAQVRLEKAFRSGYYHENSPASPLRLHLLIFSTYIDEWRWYMDDLGKHCLDIVIRHKFYDRLTLS